MVLLHKFGCFAGNILSLLGWHRVEDVKEILVGLGLQVVRLVISGLSSLFTGHFLNCLAFYCWIGCTLRGEQPTFF